LGRSALIIAIENENLQLIELLLSYKINPNDALLHAINEEFVEGIKS
jgi:ankyrin repeat protein